MGGVSKKPLQAGKIAAKIAAKKSCEILCFIRKLAKTISTFAFRRIFTIKLFA
jgi:hypothetical protein